MYEIMYKSLLLFLNLFLSGLSSRAKHNHNKAAYSSVANQFNMALTLAMEMFFTSNNL